MNKWINKNRKPFYEIMQQLEEHHLKGGYGGELNLNRIHTLITEMYKEINDVQIGKELALADLKTSNDKVKELESKLKS